MYNLRILHKFNGHFGSSVRFSEPTEHFPEHPDNCFKYLAKLKSKTAYSFTLFQRKRQNKRNKTKGRKTDL